MNRSSPRLMLIRLQEARDAMRLALFNAESVVRMPVAESSQESVVRTYAASIARGLRMSLLMAEDQILRLEQSAALTEPQP